MKVIFAFVTSVAAVQLDAFPRRDPKDVWIPYSLKQGDIQYYNPAQDRSVSILPAGSRKATERVALLETHANGTHVANGDGNLPWDGDCSPKCKWQCKHIECEKDCKPKCDLPKCQTRCKSPDLGKCNIKCSTKPHCATFCPPQRACKELPDGTHECKKPDCATKCEHAKCFIFCGSEEERACENVCAEPTCEWSCKNPKFCPKPECRLSCATPECKSPHESYELPQVQEGQQALVNFTAKESPDFTVGEWSSCDCKTGKQFRDVRCNSPLNVCGLEATPATSRDCEKPCDGHYEFGDWSDCKGECFGKGYQVRKGQCVLGNCGGVPEKEELRKCSYDHARCKTCQATLYGGPFYDGWKETFNVGSFEQVDFRARNIKCMDTSSLKVTGFCCHARLFEYGDKNEDATEKGETAWKVVYPEGSYTKEDLEARGGFNDQTSSLEVFRDPHCIKARQLRAGAGPLSAVSALAFVALALVW